MLHADVVKGKFCKIKSFKAFMSSIRVNDSNYH